MIEIQIILMNISIIALCVVGIYLRKYIKKIRFMVAFLQADQNLLFDHVQELQLHSIVLRAKLKEIKRNNAGDS